jgi:hypothetical protein
VSSESAPRYCTAESLAYAASAWSYQSGAPLLFDEAYRVAHLPLVAPEHPAVLSHLAPLDYESGRYRRTRYSLIVPVEAAALQRAPGFQALEHELARQNFAPKIARELLEQRAAKLHLTLAGGLQQSELDVQPLPLVDVLRAHGPLRYRLGGPFVGAKNHGRIYFPAYPEFGPQGNVFSALQRSMGRPETRLYLLGFYHLREELTPPEAAELHAFLERWAHTTVAELTAASLAIIGTHDDLALDSEIVVRISAEGCCPA